MARTRTDLAREILVVILITAGLFAWSSCGRSEKRIATGAVIPGAQLPLGGFHADDTYRALNSQSIPLLYEDFRNVLFKQGLVKWDARFDCNHFASLYIGLAQSRFAVAAWHSSSKAQTLALAEFWYQPASGGAHAIVAAVTETGLVFIEPQTGKPVTLTPAEQASAFLVKW